MRLPHHDVRAQPSPARQAHTVIAISIIKSQQRRPNAAPDAEYLNLRYKENKYNRGAPTQPPLKPISLREKLARAKSATACPPERLAMLDGAEHQRCLAAAPDRPTTREVSHHSVHSLRRTTLRR